MLGRLILVFILVPLVDLILLLRLSDYIGWKSSVAMVILSGILGAWLAKRSYRAVLQRFLRQSNPVQSSTELLTDGAMIFFAAGLLLTPGFLTDAVGFSLLIPVCRRWYKARLSAWLKRNFKFQTVSMDEMHRNRDDGVVDGEVLHPQASPVQRLE